ncbi:MAG: lipid-binding SYLF domain-containing protein [Pseudomonadota bacterium]|nr:lipid-binding SYLF domain-containing protein [Pseudomonadota bacterium]
MKIKTKFKAIGLVIGLFLFTPAWNQQITDSINSVVDSIKDSLKDVIEASAHEIDRDANIAVDLLIKEIEGSRLFLNQAYGYLVFPRVVKVGMGIGVETGEGVLKVSELNEDYYRITSGSLGFQVGAQAKAIVIAFMTEDMLNSFRNNPGWKVGVDGHITIIDKGLGATINTDNVLDPIVAFVFDSRGLMYSLTLEGSVFTMLDKSN